MRSKRTSGASGCPQTQESGSEFAQHERACRADTSCHGASWHRASQLVRVLPETRRAAARGAWSLTGLAASALTGPSLA